MIYDPQRGALKGRTKSLREAIRWSSRLLGVFLGLGFFTSEILRIKSLPPSLSNDLYLALLFLVGLLTGYWWWVTNKELDALCEWLDPKAYEPPDDSLVAIGITAVLALMIFSSRSPILFGIIYSVYNAANFLACRHLQHEVAEATRASRERLDLEGSDMAKVYGQAINVIEAYYVDRPHLLRIAITLTLSLVGLALAIGAKTRHTNL